MRVVDINRDMAMKQLDVYVQELLNRLGLGNLGFHIRVDEKIGYPGMAFQLAVSKQITIDRMKESDDLIRDAFNPIAEAMENSPLVREITNEQANEIEELNSRIEMLEAQVQNLIPYKQHYDLEFELNHGNARGDND